MVVPVARARWPQASRSATIEESRSNNHRVTRLAAKTGDGRTVLVV
jgi:hypothetical protein